MLPGKPGTERAAPEKGLTSRWSVGKSSKFHQPGLNAAMSYAFSFVTSKGASTLDIGHFNITHNPFGEEAGRCEQETAVLCR